MFRKIFNLRIAMAFIAFMLPIQPVLAMKTIILDHIYSYKFSEGINFLVGDENVTGQRITVEWENKPYQSSTVGDRCANIFELAISDPGRYYVSIETSSYRLQGCEIGVKE
ncbi:hypothetical protein [Vibrio sagamiensis]|uniref:Uncharacterized protein n=1 Tax=Vibrio sagamiensis NBRC 104589 TaxID=1219064 RepID=A0A511QCN8_9VIBR|nr:hypothetical protein [Vibrio sagamiensis]GEM75053.1 hypothetical protein VSA01S_11650 [Vibrio sagamiensis NBRC 104589]